jgi:hypothetical protein
MKNTTHAFDTHLRCLTTALWLLLAVSMSTGAIMLNDFETVSGWRVETSNGISAEIAQDAGRTGMGLRLDFNFHGGGGFVIAHKLLSMTLPDNYNFSFYVRGEAPLNTLEFKLIDPTGENVWWAKRRDFRFTGDWQKVTIKKRHVGFAWGPSGDGQPRQIGAIELALSAGHGGKGSIWIDDLEFEPREPTGPYTATPDARASTTAEGFDTAALFDPDPATGWRSGSVAEEQWLQVDFRKLREYGGLILDWDPDDYAKAYRVLVSDDGKDWQPAYKVDSGNGGRDYVYLPDVESRYLRLELQHSSRGQGYAIKSLQVKPYQFSSTPNDFFSAIAHESPRGAFPRYFAGEQSYWTVVGVAGDDKEALINQDGMVEVDKGRFSIEPFLHIDGDLITWSDASPRQDLAEGYLPIPTVTWQAHGLRLAVTALAAGSAGDSMLYLRYHLQNTTDKTRQGNLYLAVRPFQVNPPWQSLNMSGGVSQIQELNYADYGVVVDASKTITSLSPAERFGAAKFEQGSITDYLRDNELPGERAITDDFGYASGALQYDFDLAPGESRDVFLVVPFHEPPSLLHTDLSKLDAAALWAQAFQATSQFWRRRLNHVVLKLPETAHRLADTLRSTLAYILINQDGPALQPGSRDYARSWIRDGALTSSALLSTGYVKPVREFIRWYAGYQFPNGKVPCCVDQRGADSVAENDSHGEWLYLIAQYYRFTHDAGLVTELWPSIVKAVNYIDSQRRLRMTPEYQSEDQRLYYGLMPESISHEGYSAHPVHSYWDDFFTLRGLKDAAYLAQTLGEDEAVDFAAIRDVFAKDLHASLELAMTRHGIDYIPGSAELGDFDATSTTIAIDPGGELDRLPEPALSNTFETYYDLFRKRKTGEIQWEAYTPYELRIVGTLVRMGHKARAHELLEFFFEGQRPEAWNQWAEVVWREPNAPRFIGDMPHTWAGSDFIRSLRSLFVYERESDQALVLGAGIPAEWVTEGGGVTLQRLPTYYGTLNYTLHKGEGEYLTMTLSGDLGLPPGKIVIRSPMSVPLTAVTVNGRAVPNFQVDEVVVDEFPAEVLLYYEAAPALARRARGGAPNP